MDDMEKSCIDKELYKKLVVRFSQLSMLFSDSDKPYIPYRFAERLFNFCINLNHFNYKDLSREDNSFDTLVLCKDSDLKFGVGIKTFVDSTTTYKDEKVAEFTKYASKHNLKNLRADDLIYKVASLRNDRVLSDVNEYGINIEDSIYHCLVRSSNKVFVHEEPYPIIDINNLVLYDKEWNAIKDIRTYQVEGVVNFSDGKNYYKFNTSKNTLFKRFDLIKSQSPIPVVIDEHPFDFLLGNNDLILNSDKKVENNEEYTIDNTTEITTNYVVLPLYTTSKSRNGNMVVAEASGINQWNAGGRERKFGEAYIPIPHALLQANWDFFCFKDGKAVDFNLELPNGEVITARLCQANFKALMSDPNTKLLNWLYEVIDGSYAKAESRFNKQNKELNRPYTYEDLERIGKDSVALIRVEQYHYKIKFMPLGAFELFKNLDFKPIMYHEFLEKLNSAQKPLD